MSAFGGREKAGSVLMEAQLARIESLWGKLSQGLDGQVESVPAALVLLWLLPAMFGLAQVGGSHRTVLVLCQG